MNMLPYSGFPALPKNIEDMHNQLVTLGLNDVEALTARIKKCEDWVDNVEETELTGNPVVFQNALAIPAASLAATIEPIQDLHGYDHPWAGGAGKNKQPLDITAIKAANTTGTWTGNVYAINNGTIEILTDSSGNAYGVKVNGTFNATFTFLLSTTDNTAGQALRGDYVVSVTNAMPENCNYSIGKSTSGYWDMGRNASMSVSLTDAEHWNGRTHIYIYNGSEWTDHILYPMIRLSTASAEFEPWENICPISGRTEARVDDVGKNYCRNDLTSGSKNNIVYTVNADKSVRVVGQASANTTIHLMGTSLSPYKDLPNGNYILSKGNTNNKTILSLDKYNGTTWVGQVISSSTDNVAVNLDYNGYDGVVISIYILNGSNVDQMMYPMLRLATESDATYEPYATTNATIQLGQTVYGGTVDFNGGTAEVTDGYIASYDGETLPSTWISDRDVYAAGTTPTTGAEVVYKLATPTTLQLTPSQLQMLKGYNRVSSDDASSITIEAYTGGPWEAVTRAIKKVTNKTKTTKKRRK